jgi:hypothetical protein
MFIKASEEHQKVRVGQRKEFMNWKDRIVVINRRELKYS